jgi:hypothetical protein
MRQVEEIVGRYVPTSGSSVRRIEKEGRIDVSDPWPDPKERGYELRLVVDVAIPCKHDSVIAELLSAGWKKTDRQLEWEKVRPAMDAENPPSQTDYTFAHVERRGVQCTVETGWRGGDTRPVRGCVVILRCWIEDRGNARRPPSH